MKKGEIYRGRVDRVDFPNKGIVNSEDGSCVIKNVLPGQDIEFMVTKKRGGKCEGKVVNIISQAANEIESRCPHFGICGGCTYQNLGYEEQLILKGNQVKSLLDNALTNQSEPYDYQGVIPSPIADEYRNKMEFSFGDTCKGGELALGMHKRGSFYDVETVDNCLLVDEDFRKILSLTLSYFKDIPFLHKMTHIGYLRHLLVRKAKRTGEILVALVTTSQNVDGVDDIFLDNWKNELLKLRLKEAENKLPAGNITGILHIANDSLADIVQADKMDILFGRDYINEELLGLKFRISVFSFFQTNSLGAEVLYSTARDYIGELKKDGEPQATVFDLFSGTGTIAQIVAPSAKKVIGVEIVEEAVEAARENAAINNLDNCEFIAADVLKALDNITEKPDFIILDPPRDGIHPKALKKIIDYGVDRLIYISCKPTSLARDLEMFLGNNYVVKKACCVDMFPATANIETVVLLSKKP